ncbi:hypothetical protein TIFTF001_032142 [Ficus carica]|uniref:Uncharacterized protein n=1 Tax=Ficus carica TaxID=3494 RepID=A0AA88DVW6_FICCA|nr:hypothetical protein TIFTF001_032142 [Ficus carica]
MSGSSTDDGSVKIPSDREKKDVRRGDRDSKKTLPMRFDATREDDSSGAGVEEDCHPA